MLDRGTTAQAAGVCSGVATALLVTLQAHDLGYPVWEYYQSPDVLPVSVALLVGAVPAVVLVRYGLVLPASVLAVAVAGWLRADANPVPGEPGLDALYALLAVLLAAIVLTGWVETELRGGLGAGTRRT